MFKINLADTKQSTYTPIDVTSKGLSNPQAEFIASSTSHGNEIIHGSAYNLLIDLDSKDSHESFCTGFELLRNKLAVLDIRSWPSKSTKGIHVLIAIDNVLSAQDIVLWQLILGSDPTRERWNAIRHSHGAEISDWNLLAKPRINIHTYGNCPIMLWCNNCRQLTCLSNNRYLDELHDANRTWRCLYCSSDRCKVIEA